MQCFGVPSIDVTNVYAQCLVPLSSKGSVHYFVSGSFTVNIDPTSPLESWLVSFVVT